MPEVSITLPSLRPEALLQRVKEFSITNKDVDYEIVVVSPFTVKQDRVVHIYEEKQLGNTYAFNVAYKNSSGEYVVWWADYISPTANCLSNMLSFVKSRKEPFIGAFSVKDGQGRKLLPVGVYGKLYACFGCVSKNTINLIGGYFDSVYKAYWADPDMCLRAWRKGGEVKVCPNTWVVMEYIVDKLKKDSRSQYFDKDKETFLNRWHNLLGNRIERDRAERDWTIINKPMYCTWDKLRIALHSKLSSIPYLKKIKQNTINRLFYK